MNLAAVIPAPNQPLEVREFVLPTIEPGAVLLETIYSEVCGTDVYLQRGDLAGVPYPLIPGHVSVGRVLETRGAVLDVDRHLIQQGDVVTFLDVHETCNHCWYCLVAKTTTRCPSRKVYGITYSADDGLLGGWSQHIYLKPGVKIIRLPASVTPRLLIAAGCALPTALHAMERAEVQLGDFVVVQGCGPVGLNLALLARLSGALRVIAIDVHPHRLRVAAEFAADETVVLNPSSPDEVCDKVSELTEGRGADVVLEATGMPAAIPAGLRMTREGGRYVVVGHYTDHGDVDINPHTDINRRHLEIRGCWGSDFSHFYRMVRVLERFATPPAWSSGWESLVSRSYGLHQANEALVAVADGVVIKALIEPR